MKSPGECVYLAALFVRVAVRVDSGVQDNKQDRIVFDPQVRSRKRIGVSLRLSAWEGSRGGKALGSSWTVLQF